MFYLLWRDVKRDRSQIDLHEGIGARQNEENTYRQEGKRVTFDMETEKKKRKHF